MGVHDCLYGTRAYKLGALVMGQHMDIIAIYRHSATPVGPYYRAFPVQQLRVAVLLLNGFMQVNNM